MNPSFLNLSAVFLSKITKYGNFPLIIHIVNAFLLNLILFYKIVNIPIDDGKLMIPQCFTELENALQLKMAHIS